MIDRFSSGKMVLVDNITRNVSFDKSLVKILETNFVYDLVGNRQRNGLAR